MTTNRDKALAHFEDANANSGDLKKGTYPPAVALIGIGHALLEVADAIREKAANEVTMADLNAWTDRWIRTQTAAQQATHENTTEETPNA